MKLVSLFIINVFESINVFELIDVYETTNQPLDEASVEKAFAQLLNVRNDIYFEHYYSRLKDAFSEPHQRFAAHLLDLLSEKETLSKDAVVDLAKEHQLADDLETILEALMYDGYFHFDNGINAYRFNSYLLQSWWDKKNLH